MMVESGRAVTTCGLATMDCTYDVERAPGEDEKVRARDVTLRIGGPAARAAAAARRLEVASTLVTCLGDSPIEAWIARRLGDERVEVHVAGRPRVPPVASVVVAPERGTRSVTSAIDAEPVLTGDPGTAAGSLVAGRGCLLVDGHYTPLAHALAVAARAAGVPVLADAGSWREELASVLARADVVIAGEPFARDVGGVDAAIALVRGLGVHWVAVTRGAGPIRWAAPGDAGEIAPDRVEARNTNGAGDILHGAAAAAIARRGLPTTAAAFVTIVRAAAFVAARAVAHDDPLEALDAAVASRFEALLA